MWFVKMCFRFENDGECTYLCRFIGVFVSSAVGTSCSPGRTHKIGPSFDSRGSICTIDFSPHGIVLINEGKSTISYQITHTKPNDKIDIYLFEERIVFKSSQKVWKISADFFVHFAN